MVQKFQIDSFLCDCVVNAASTKVAYMLYPHVNGFAPVWLENMSDKYGITIVAVYIPLNEWNDILTPWAEPGEAKGCQPFAGHAVVFYKELIDNIIPKTDSFLKLENVGERDLFGVSLAGLFTLWQWLQHDTFESIACLSGSFWYNGLLDWFDGLKIPKKHGKAYFLLGVEEPKAKIKAYHSVGINTEAIVARLKSSGIDTTFDWVPGNHFTDPFERAEKALSNIYKTT